MELFKNLFRSPKSDLDNKSINYIASLVMMFDGWSIDNGFGGICLADRILVIKKLLIKEGFSGTKKEIDAITLGIININPEYDLSLIRKFRQKRKFDQNVINLCKNIELPERLFLKHLDKIDSESQRNVQDYAQEANIIPKIENDVRLTFIIELSIDNEKFASELNRNGGKVALQEFIEIIDLRIKKLDFDNPDFAKVKLHEEDPKLRNISDAQRIVCDSNKAILFEWSHKS